MSIRYNSLYTILPLIRAWLTYLRNVFSFDKVVNIKENLNWNSKLEQIIDNFLHSVICFHVCRRCPLFLPQWSWTAFEYDFFNNSSKHKITILSVLRNKALTSHPAASRCSHRCHNFSLWPEIGSIKSHLNPILELDKGGITAILSVSYTPTFYNFYSCKHN